MLSVGIAETAYAQFETATVLGITAPSPQDFRNIDADFGLSNYHQPYNNTTNDYRELRPAAAAARIQAELLMCS